MLINRRNALMAGKRLSAKSYVQDGLVSMWDGIENAGWGVHDPNATTWKDLAGTYDAAMVGSPAWNEDHANTFGGSGYFDTGKPIPAYLPFTVEIIWKPLGRPGNDSQPLGSNGTGGFTLICRGSNLWAVANGSPYVWTNFSTIMPGDISSCVCSVDSVQKCFYNGVLKNYNTASTWRVHYPWRIGRSGNSSSYCNAEFYCVRLYSRALTADEIAANYAVDKARFNLPDAT